MCATSPKSRSALTFGNFLMCSTGSVLGTRRSGSENVFHFIFYLCLYVHVAPPIPAPSPKRGKKGLRAKLLCQWPKVPFCPPFFMPTASFISCSFFGELASLGQQPKRKVRCTLFLTTYTYIYSKSWLCKRYRFLEFPTERLKTDRQFGG